MKIESKYVFDENDYKLLKKSFPECPCDKCHIGRLTCHEYTCDKYKMYDQKLEPYKNNNILEIAMKVSRYYTLQSKLIQLAEECNDILRKIPVYAFDENNRMTSDTFNICIVKMRNKNGNEDVFVNQMIDYYKLRNKMNDLRIQSFKILKKLPTEVIENVIINR